MKLTEYIEIAAAAYLHETGNFELDSRWIAEFFEDSGIQYEYPRQDLIAFSKLVQKSLTKQSERAEKQTRSRLDTIIRIVKNQSKP